MERNGENMKSYIKVTWSDVDLKKHILLIPKNKICDIESINNRIKIRYINISTINEVINVNENIENIERQMNE